jgi:hypothetical protein
MKITIKMVGAREPASPEEVERWARSVLMDALHEFAVGRSFQQTNCRDYMDKRYPVEQGGVYTAEPARTKKLKQTQLRCRVAGMLRNIDTIEVTEEKK